MTLTPLLSPIALLYGLAVSLRNALFDRGLLRSRSFPLPVICVGNLAVGGTGKTPHVEHILRLLHADGYKVAMLSRGYGRQTKGFRLCSEGDTARETGDEPLQIKRNCPFATVAVCEDRCAGIERLLAGEERPDAVVLDDAMQHRYVKPGLTMLLTDSRRLYTKDHLLPRGRLREPQSEARRADVVVVTKCAAENRPKVAVFPHQKLFYTGLAYGTPYRFALGPNVSEESGDKQPITGACVLVITGVASPEALYAHIRNSRPRRMAALRFADHYEFTPADVKKMNDAYLRLTDGLPDNTPRLALTTEKDAVRLGQCDGLNEALRAALWVQPVRVELLDKNPNKPTLNQIILHYVRENQRNRSLD